MSCPRILILSLTLAACATSPEPQRPGLTESVATELGMAAAAAPTAPEAVSKPEPAALAELAPTPVAIEAAAPVEAAAGDATTTLVAAPVEASAEPAEMEPAPTELPSEVLDLLRSSTFQRQFAQSYIAETELEPTVTQPEREDLQEVLNAISSDDLDTAIALLTERGGDAASATFDFMLGNIHFQREDNEIAIAAYGVAVTKYPKFLRAWKNKGICHIRSADFECDPCFTEVLQLGRGDAVTYGLLGWAYSNAERYLPAESAYRMAILLDPETTDFQLGLARALFKQGRFEVAASLVGG